MLAARAPRAKKVTIGKEIEKRNKQNLFISQGLLLPEKMIIILKLQNTDKLIFSLASTGTSQRHDVKENFLKHVYNYYIIS